MRQQGSTYGWALLARPQDSSGSPGEILQLICIAPLTLPDSITHPGPLRVELEFASGMGREVWQAIKREPGDCGTTITLAPVRPGQAPLALALIRIKSGAEVDTVTELRISSGGKDPLVLCREAGGIRFFEEGNAKA